MKRNFRQMMFGMLAALACVLLSGCIVGDYHIFDAYADENGEQHFMGFGEKGPRGGEEDTKDDHSVEEVVDMQENENDYDPESIVGTTLKRGWTSTDSSILRGKNVSVKENSILFLVDLQQEKEIVISCDLVLDEGEYQLVYTGPDGTERILQESKEVRSEEKILFAQGQNKISVLSNNAVFKEIDISITGILSSDFDR